jgi:hypothetical protein
MPARRLQRPTNPPVKERRKRPPRLTPWMTTHNSQIPPDLVVKSQAVDIIEVI